MVNGKTIYWKKENDIKTQEHSRKDFERKKTNFLAETNPNSSPPNKNYYPVFPYPVETYYKTFLCDQLMIRSIRKYLLMYLL